MMSCPGALLGLGGPGYTYVCIHGLLMARATIKSFAPWPGENGIYTYLQCQD